MLAFACYTASPYAKEQSKDLPSEPLPNKAFLEYLSELKEVNGELIGPLDMLEVKNDLKVAKSADSSIQQKTTIENTKTQFAADKSKLKGKIKIESKEDKQ